MSKAALKVQFLSATHCNPSLSPATVAGMGDLATLWDGKGTFAENLIEFAGRVCYRSTHRMGTAPEFISARVREGHEDIIEHVVVSIRISDSDEPLRWRMINRHCEVSELGNRAWLVSGNTRVWLDFFRRGIALEAVPILKAVAPAVFAEFKLSEGSAVATGELSPAGTVRPALLPVEDGAMRVTLLGYTQPVLDDAQHLVDHGSATFLFEGISRALTHQLVRHRLASFSQESQRYVSLEKGEWKAIVPPKMAENPAAMAIIEDAWQYAEQKYGELYDLGIRKEDARFLLPNAAETRIITTMNFAAWSHFMWLRAVDKAAQWEIRKMGQYALKMLYEIAPAVFEQQWQVYQKEMAKL